MDLNSEVSSGVFADWLDVTCSPKPGESFLDDVQYALDSLGAYVNKFEKEDKDRSKLTYHLGSGTILLIRSKRFHKVGCSGAALSEIRYRCKLDYFLSCIGSVPHSITRLDVALDFNVDGADIFSAYEKRYSKPSRYPKLTRKTVTPTYISSLRPSDGRRTGTVNVGGYKNTKVSARIYDKQHQMLEKFGEEIPPTTRFELTVRKDMSPSLRDVSEPTAIFWHYMGRSVLKAPKGIPSWEAGWGGEWSMVVEKPLVYEVVKAKIESNPELLRIFELADSMSGDGREIALNMIRRQHIERTQLKLSGTKT